MNKVPIILGALVIILFAICMNTKELFTSPLNIFNSSSNTSPSTPYKPLSTTSDEQLNAMNSDNFFNGTYTLTDDEFKPTNQNIEVIVFKRNYDLLFLVKSVYTKVEPGQPCTSSNQCTTGVCDTDGVYGCQGKCIVSNRDSSKGADFNCSVQIGASVGLGVSKSEYTSGETSTIMTPYIENKNKKCSANQISKPCSSTSNCDSDTCNQKCLNEDECNYAFSNTNGGCYLYSDCSSTKTATYTGTISQKSTSLNDGSYSESGSVTTTDFRTYKTLKSTIINNFKTTGTFLVDSGAPLSSYREYELVNILPPGSKGDFNMKDGVIYFTNNNMTFTKVRNDTYETFTNNFRDTSNQYYTNIPNIITPQIQLTTTDTSFDIQAGHSNNYLLNPILNLDVTNNCSILDDFTNNYQFKNAIIFTKVNLTDNQGGQVYKSLGTQFFGPDNDQSSLILEVTDLTKYIHGTSTVEDVSDAVLAFKSRLSSLESKEEAIAQEYISCLNTSSSSCDYGSTSGESTNCTDLLPGELYSLENEIDSMELTQWKIESMIKKEGANICAFQMHTMPEYNTLKASLWAEANNNGTAGISLERGGDRRNTSFDKNGKSQNWYFDDGELIGTSDDNKIGLYKVKIRSSNGLYLSPSKSFQGFSNMSTRVVLTRDNSTWWYILATTEFNSSVLTVLDNNLQMNTMFVDDNTSTNSRTSYYCPTSYPYRYGSAEAGYYCSTKSFSSDGTTSGTKCCLEKGLNTSCQSQCCPTNICPTDMTEESGTNCYPESDVGSTSNFCDLTGSSADKCYP